MDITALLARAALPEHPDLHESHVAELSWLLRRDPNAWVRSDAATALGIPLEGDPTSPREASGS